MSEELDLDAVVFITIDTIGPPGQRVFHLQAGQDNRLFTFIIEKEQASALADTITAMLNEIETQFKISTLDGNAEGIDFELREPILPIFHIGQMGLGYDSDQDRVVLLLHELRAEDVAGEPRSARVAATRQQMRALVNHSREVIAGGRPTCGNCGKPMDPEGHFCPRSNGHKRERASV